MNIKKPAEGGVHVGHVIVVEGSGPGRIKETRSSAAIGVGVLVAMVMMADVLVARRRRRRGMT